MKFKKTNLKKWDLVEVKWQDACRQQGGWCVESQFDYGHAVDFADSMRAVGYITHMSKDHIFIAQESCDSDGAIGHVLSIPSSCIMELNKIKKLK